LEQRNTQAFRTNLKETEEQLKIKIVGHGKHSDSYHINCLSLICKEVEVYEITLSHLNTVNKIPCLERIHQLSVSDFMEAFCT
jgi:hypothetical protein